MAPTVTSQTAADIGKLRTQLTTLKKEAAKNEEILRRAQSRELYLLQAESLVELLERLVGGLADSHGLNAVTLVLLDPHHEVRHLLMGDGARLQELHGVIFVDALHEFFPLYGSLKAPWLGPFSAGQHTRLFPASADLGSVALLPLLRQGRIIGSLNFGSADAQRFTRQHATDFLNHLATIVAFCLENAVNRSRLIRSGLTDVLTGWHNRRYLETRILEELARAGRERTCLACLLLDVDVFKRINDSFGHPAGDRVLREMARRVESQVRASDVAARYGGDEFAILLPATTLNDALTLAERIRAAVCAAPISMEEGQAITVTISIGAATASPGARATDFQILADTLLGQADAELYRAKEGGRNCVRGHR